MDESLPKLHNSPTTNSIVRDKTNTIQHGKFPAAENNEKKVFDDEFERQPIKIYTPVQTSVRVTDVSLRVEPSAAFREKWNNFRNILSEVDSRRGSRRLAGL